MSALKRNIILSNKSVKTNEMAILTIEKLNSGIIGTLKIFNINKQNLLLAISCNDEESFKGEVKLDNNVFAFKLHQNFDIGGKISCVVVENDGNKITPLVWDSVTANKNLQEKVDTYFENSAHSSTPHVNHQTTFRNKNLGRTPNMFAQNNALHQKEAADLDKMFGTHQDESFSNKTSNNIKSGYQNKSSGNKQSELSTIESLFEPAEEKELDELVDKSLKQNYTNAVFGKETENLKKKIDENSIFYDLVSDQIEDIFSKYPNEEDLEKLIPNSKWVLVDYENEGNPYVLGLIYEDTVLKYICYGVPGEFAQNPPKDIEQYSQWLPKNPNNINLGGYWVMYQDAVSGDNLLIEYI